MQMQNQNQNYISEEQLQMQRLPSRDIPRDSAGYIQDEQIKPNYIPPAPISLISFPAIVLY